MKSVVLCTDVPVDVCLAQIRVHAAMWVRWLPPQGAGLGVVAPLETASIKHHLVKM